MGVCFVAEFFTFFKIDASRGSKVLYDTLGDDFLGSIGSDFFSAYLKYLYCLTYEIRFWGKASGFRITRVSRHLKPEA